MKLVIIIIIILFLGAFYTLREQQTNLKNVSSVYDFGKTYIKWVGKLGKNLTTLAISAYQMKWLPEKKIAGTTQIIKNMQNKAINNSITINLP